MTVWIERGAIALLALLVGTEAASGRIAEASLAPASAVAAVRGHADAAIKPIDTSEGLVVLITFSGTCPTTRTNMPIWRAAATAALTKGSRVVWVSRDRAPAAFAFAREQALPGVILADVPYDEYIRLGLSVVPQTIVLKGGVVQASWQGAVDLSSINRALGHPGAHQGGRP